MLVFVAGAHGVGKTHLLKQVAPRLGATHATASELIREARGHSSWAESRIVDEVEQNQVALISAVAKLRAAVGTLFLDGHFVLRSGLNRHEVLPSQVFEELGCDAVVLLSCPSDVVLSRLVGREDKSWTEAEVVALMRAESDQATIVCASLMIPLVRLHSPTTEECEAQLAAVIRRAV